MGNEKKRIEPHPVTPSSATDGALEIKRAEVRIMEIYARRYPDSFLKLARKLGVHIPPDASNEQLDRNF